MIADIVVAGVLLLSGGLAYSMGLAKFLMLIGSWLGAAVAAYLGFTHLGGIFESFVDDPLFQAVGAALLMFVITLTVLTVVTHKICNQIRGSVLGHMDRALGFALGLVLGVVLVSLIYVGATLFWEEDDFPDQIAEAKTLPLIRAGAEVLVSLLPEGPIEDTGDLGDAIDDAGNAVKDMATDQMKEAEKKLESIEEEQLKKLLQPSEDEKQDENAPGYETDERSDMQNLIIENNQ